MLSPSITHSLYSSSSTRLQAERWKGLTPKFAANGNLVEFLIKVRDHLEYTGMDTITYAPDPVEVTTMRSVVVDHPRFSTEYVREAIEDQVTKYDAFDKSNDSTATHFLLESLDEDMRVILRDLCEGEVFPVYVMELIEYVRRASTDHFAKLSDDIKKRKPSQYSGQDLEQMAKAMCADAKELTQAGQCDHRLTLHMLDNFLEAGGPENETFRFPFRLYYIELRKAIDKVSLMQKDEADKFMLKAKLTYRDICTEVVRQFRILSNDSRWSPAQLPKDTRTVPAKYAQLAAAEGIAGSEAWVSVQNSGKKPSSKANDTCRNCWKPGHWAKDCRAPKVDKSQQQQQRGGKRPPRSSNPKNNRTAQCCCLEEDSTWPWRTSNQEGRQSFFPLVRPLQALVDYKWYRHSHWPKAHCQRVCLVFQHGLVCFG